MKKFQTTIIFALAAMASLAHAESELHWRQSGDGSYRFQIQGWGEDSQPPLIFLSPLISEKTSDGEDSPQKVQLPELKPMSVKGTWQLKSWKPEGLTEGIYSMSSSKVDDKTKLSDRLSLSNNLKSLETKLHHHSGKISWKQTKPGAVRVLLMYSSGLVVADASNGWKVYAAGEHVIESDFMSLDGIDYRYNSGVIGVVQLAEFPNDIFVQGNPTLKHENLPAETYDISATLKELPKSNQQALRVELTKDALKKVGTRRYEILIYADGMLLHEEAQAVSPYTYLLPDNLSKSTQQVSVSILDYEGNFGVKTLDLPDHK